MRLIDADALKEYIHNQDGRPFIGITIGEAFQMMVDEQPTIEERKTGEWEKVSASRYRTRASYAYKCSACGAIYWLYSNYYYCPNCGADMRGGNT